MLGALHHESSPRNRHGHLMNEHVLMFLNFSSLCMKVNMGSLRSVGHAEGRKKRKK